MKVMQVHNRYQWRGGEDVVVDNTVRLLNSRGVECVLFEKNSAEVAGLRNKAKAAVSGIYSAEAAREMKAALARERPDVVHIHNLFPLLSPSVLHACRATGVPVVMTIHNYRLTCPIGVHFRDGKVCVDCVKSSEVACAWHNCRGNRMQSAVYAVRNAVIRRRRMIVDPVDRFIAISHCVQDQLVKSGVQVARIDVVHNMVSVPAGIAKEPGTYVGFVGRLSEEKGLDVFLDAARQLPNLQFKIAGDGPLREKLQAAAPSNVAFMGALDKAELAQFYAGASLLVVSSIWMETFGLVAAEAMAHGVPVVASRIGALPEIVEDGVTGRLFHTGDAASLAAIISEMLADETRLAAMGRAARARAMECFSEDHYFERLMRVYEDVLASREAKSIDPTPSRPESREGKNEAEPAKVASL